MTLNAGLTLNIKSSAESQKGVNAVQRCSIENQKGALSLYKVYGNNALLVLNGTLLNSVNTLLVLNFLADKIKSLRLFFPSNVLLKVDDHYEIR